MKNLSIRSERGSLHVGILAVVVALAVVGGIGYYVATKSVKSDKTSTTATSKQTSAYKSADDVTKADDSLNTSDVDQSVDTSALDQDVDNML